MSPLVSVLMTAYNREKYIGEAIESVLESSFGDWELIISDDLSVDKTVEIARHYENLDKRIKVFVNSKNLGDYPNRNKAASYASGKYLKYLDADDVIYYYGLEVMVRFMERFPEAGFGLSSYPDDECCFPRLISPREIFLESFGNCNHFSRGPGSSIIRRDVFEKLGGFSGKQFVGDQEFWLKISMYHSLVKLPQDLYWNRLHAEQQSKLEQKRQVEIDRLRDFLVESALNHQDLPLDKEQKLKLFKKFKKKKYKQYIFSKLKYFKIS